jgi:hypothetical protein
MDPSANETIARLSSRQSDTGALKLGWFSRASSAQSPAASTSFTMK